METKRRLFRRWSKVIVKFLWTKISLNHPTSTTLVECSISNKWSRLHRETLLKGKFGSSSCDDLIDHFSVYKITKSFLNLFILSFKSSTNKKPLLCQKVIQPNSQSVVHLISLNIYLKAVRLDSIPNAIQTIMNLTIQHQPFGYN